MIGAPPPLLFGMHRHNVTFSFYSVLNIDVIQKYGFRPYLCMSVFNEIRVIDLWITLVNEIPVLSL